MAAEIGTMRVTDQIDALDTYQPDPCNILSRHVCWRVLSVPFLVLVGDIIGVLGVSRGVYRLGFNPSVYCPNS